MEPPAKRQKLSQAESFPAPSRTIDLSEFQRTFYKRSKPGKVVLPRVPDVTVTAAVLEVAVNEGSLAVQVTAPATGSVAVTLSNLGTLTVPPITTSATAESSNTRSSGHALSSSGSALSSSSSSSTSHSSNSTITSSERTVTITATNTFHVSYTNGTFITPAQTYKTRPTNSTSEVESSSTSGADSTAYVFGQGFTESSNFPAQGTETQYIGSNAPANPTILSASPTNTDNNSSDPSGPVLTPQQTQMVGGIVGGLAGVAFVLVVVLYVLRWYRQRLKSRGRLPQQLESMHDHDTDYGDKALVSMAAPMSRNRTSLFAPVAMKKFRPRSDITVNTMSTAGDSEKGFRRVSGRKIPSVLSTGGDQYGGSFGAFEKEVGGTVVKTKALGSMPFKSDQDMSGKSFYNDSDGTTYIGSTPSRTNLISSVPASPLSPQHYDKTRPRPHPARRPSAPYSNPASALASPTVASPYANHMHNSSSTSADSQFDPAVFDAAYERNLTQLANMARGHPKPDGFAISRNSPARTPVIQSPGASTLRIPMGVTPGYSMDDDVPEMPLPSPGINFGISTSGVRIPSGLSAVSSGRDSTVSGRFKEELS